MSGSTFGSVRRIIISAVSLLGVASVAVFAQKQEQPTLMLTGLIGTGMIDNELGLTGGLGLAIGTPRYVVRAVFDVHVPQPEDGHYSWEIDPTDPTCRDDRSGAIVDQSFCSTDRALTGFSTEASLERAFGDVIGRPIAAT